MPPCFYLLLAGKFCIALVRFTPILIPTTTFLSVLPWYPQTSKPVSPEGSIGLALDAEWTPSPWYMLPKHMPFSSGATLVARLVVPLLEDLVIQFSDSSFRYF